MYARVIVDIKNRQVNRHFDYIVKDDFSNRIKKGMRVVVPFHRQIRLGYVTDILSKSDQASKEIIEILDDEPTISEETFLMIDHIYKQTHDIYASIFETVVPNQIQLRYKKEIHLIDPHKVDEAFLSCFNSKGIFRVSKSNHEYDYKIRKYQKLNAIEVKQVFEQKVNEKSVKTYTYNPIHQYARVHAYQDRLDMLDYNQSYEKQALLDLGFSVSNLQTLEKHQVLTTSMKRVLRDVKHVFTLKDKVVTLTEEQKKAYHMIKSSYGNYEPILFKGITGSGKTEIYLKVIEDLIKNQKQVLFLVPEITLIAPLAKRLKSRFDDVVIYHSGLSAGERLDAYHQAKTHQASIVLGTRSSVFLPFDALGAIMIDESHDASYMQSDHVIYDAIDIALLRGKYHLIPIILGSATPKVSRYYQAKRNKYKLIELKHRPYGIKEPHIELIDMKKELENGNTSMFSVTLKNAIEDRLNKNEQIMILFNRKGFSPFVMCRSCSHVPVCPTCGIALTYYKKDEMLKCHYCGHEEPFKKTCDACGSTSIKEVGAGIELVEAMLKKTFSKARILRMDANVTKQKGSHEALWHTFNEAQADILLGTQMIAKGLDFPKVTLVGVLMADLLLNIPSYQASEQAYNLLTQVAGRSGRFSPGDVYIQGYQLDHYAIAKTLETYEDFYEKAIYDRKIQKYEPFGKVSQILCEGTGYLKTYQEAFKLKKAINQSLSSYTVLGPVQAYIKKHNEKYRFVMTLKYEQLNQHIFKLIDQFKSDEVSFKFYPNLEIM